MWVQRRIETPKGRKSVHIRSSFLKVGKYNDALLVSGKVVHYGCASCHQLPRKNTLTNV